MTQAWTHRWDDERPRTWTTSFWAQAGNEWAAKVFHESVEKTVKDLENAGYEVTEFEDSISVKPPQWPAIGTGSKNV
jgi:hypothetical protein